MGEGEWYTNRDLFEQMIQFRSDLQELRSEMRETRAIIKRYNGLREKIEHVEEQIETLQAKAEGRSAVLTGIREWGGWLVAILSLLLAASKIF